MIFNFPQMKFLSILDSLSKSKHGQWTRKVFSKNFVWLESTQNFSKHVTKINCPISIKISLVIFLLKIINKNSSKNFSKELKLFANKYKVFKYFRDLFKLESIQNIVKHILKQTYQYPKVFPFEILLTRLGLFLKIGLKMVWTISFWNYCLYRN